MDDLLLYKFIQNKASDEEVKSVLDWLDADPENQRYFDLLDNALNAAQLNRPIRKIPIQKPHPRWNMFVSWSLRVAAILCICIGAGYYTATSLFNRKASTRISLSTLKGERVRLTLGDGTSVWLNSQSTLEYPTVFGSGERRVRVSGEALFDVEHDPKRPFIVETFACDVEVLGTKFNVTADTVSGEFSTALLRGRLRVTNMQNRAEQISMTADDFVYLQNGTLHLKPIPDPDDYLWAEGLLNIRSTSFEELMKKVEKTFGTEIIIERNDFPELEVVRGKIPISMGLDYTLRTLQGIIPFEYVEENDTNVIRIL